MTEFDERKEADTEEPPPRIIELPYFALAISDTAEDGWHVAALVRESDKLEFYARSITVLWPFTVARPMKSNRQSDYIVRPEDRSPAGTSPSRKLVVNWNWDPLDNETQQLRFYVKRNGPKWIFPRCRLWVRIGIKEEQWTRQRYVVRVRSNVVDWRGGG